MENEPYGCHVLDVKTCFHLLCLLEAPHAPWREFSTMKHYTKADGFGRIGRDRRPSNSTPPPQAACGGKVGGTYLRPKDSNATVRVRDLATGKALEGADRQTADKQDFPRIIVRCTHFQLLNSL